MLRYTYTGCLVSLSRGNSALEAIGGASSSRLHDSQGVVTTVMTVSWANTPESFISLMCLSVSPGSLPYRCVSLQLHNPLNITKYRHNVSSSVVLRAAKLQINSKFLTT